MRGGMIAGLGLPTISKARVVCNWLTDHMIELTDYDDTSIAAFACNQDSGDGYHVELSDTVLPTESNRARPIGAEH
jgi:hypothetical protein